MRKQNKKKVRVRREVEGRKEKSGKIGAFAWPGVTRAQFCPRGGDFFGLLLCVLDA